MKAVVVGGHELAEYLVGLLCQKKHEVVVVNMDYEFCKYLSNQYDICVVYGNGTKLHVLEEARIDDFDTCIALTGNDADNLAVCQLCEHFFNVQSQVCVVLDPSNAELFRRLGVEGVVSGTFMLAQAVEEEALGAYGALTAFGQERQNPLYIGHGERDMERGPRADITSAFHRIGRSI